MCGRVSLSGLILVLAACSSSSGSNVDAGQTDSGVTVDGGVIADGGVNADGGVTPDGGTVDPNVAYQTSFETPVVTEGVVNGQFPTGWTKPPDESPQDDSLAGVYNPLAAELDEALPEGSQVLALADSDQTRAAGAYLPKVAFIRAGETWEISMKVAYSKTAGDFRFLNVEASSDLGYLGEIDVETSDLSAAGAFQTFTLSIPAQAEQTALSLTFYGRAIEGHSVRIFIDDLKIRRVTSPDALPIQPLRPYIQNPSFEQPQQGMGGFDPEGSRGWTRTILGNGFAGQWRPTQIQINQAEPLAAPALGNQVVDMGTAGETTISLAVTMTSTPFAISEAGANYSALAAVGKRLDLAACQTARIAILGNGVELAHQEMAGSAAPNGGFTNLGVETGVLDASKAGQELTVSISSMNAPTNTNCRLMFDNVRGWKL